MDMQGLIGKLLPILPFALVIALAVIGISYVTYAVYRKIGGKRTITLGQLASVFLILGQNMKQVEVTLNTDLPTDAEPASLYRSRQIYNLKYGKEMASLMERTFDLRRHGGVRVDGSNRIWSFLDNEANSYMLTYSLTDGVWSLSTENAAYASMDQEELVKHRDDYENWMVSSGLLSPNAVFGTQNGDTLRWDLKRIDTDIASGDADFTEGAVMIVPSGKHMNPQNLFTVKT